MTNNVVWGVDFSARRRQELNDQIAKLVEFAATGGPIADGLTQTGCVTILHEDQFIDPPTDCA